MVKFLEVDNALQFIEETDIVIQVDSAKDKKIVRDYIVSKYPKNSIKLFSSGTQVQNNFIYFEIVTGENSGYGWNIPIFYVGCKY